MRSQNGRPPTTQRAALARVLRETSANSAAKLPSARAVLEPASHRLAKADVRLWTIAAHPQASHSRKAPPRRSRPRWSCIETWGQVRLDGELWPYDGRKHAPNPQRANRAGLAGARAGVRRALRLAAPARSVLVEVARATAFGAVVAQRSSAGNLARLSSSSRPSMCRSCIAASRARARFALGPRGARVACGTSTFRVVPKRAPRAPIDFRGIHNRIIFHSSMKMSEATSRRRGRPTAARVG